MPFLQDELLFMTYFAKQKKKKKSNNDTTAIILNYIYQRMMIYVELEIELTQIYIPKEVYKSPETSLSDYIYLR